jgi:hypothetical protein
MGESRTHLRVVRGVVQFLPAPHDAQDDACGGSWDHERSVHDETVVERISESGISPKAVQIVFLIEDELHAEPHGEFPTFRQAIDELRRRGAIPWNEEPNRAPCTSWETCSRRYEIIEYNGAREIRRVTVLEVSAAGVKWSDDFDKAE